MPTIKRSKLSTQPTSQRRAERYAIYNTARWRKLRQLKLSLAPLCERCMLQHRAVPATEVHHKVSFMSQLGDKRLELAYSINNLESLCKKCHTSEHARGQALGEGQAPKPQRLRLTASTGNETSRGVGG